jgi:hypothetical protein
MTIDEFVQAFAHHIVKLIVEEAEIHFQQMLKYEPDSKEQLRRGLVYYMYFIFDYILHSLSSKASHDHNQEAHLLLDRIRDDLVGVLMNALTIKGWEAEMMNERCMAYREAMARGKNATDSTMNLGIEFANRSANEDIRIALLAGGIFKITWENMPKGIWEGIVSYLKNK